MNKIYKVIFSKVLGQFVVTSELTKNHSKNQGGNIDDCHASYWPSMKGIGLRQIVLALCMGGLMGVPAWAATTTSLVLKDGKLVYCQDENATDNDCQSTELSIALSAAGTSTSPTLQWNGAGGLTLVNGSKNGTLSIDSNGVLKWNGSGGFSTSTLTATTNIVTPKVTIDGKALDYNSNWATANARSSGLTFDGKPITPYYGVNSANNDGNYYGQGAKGTNAIAIGSGASSEGIGGIAIGNQATTTKVYLTPRVAEGNIAIGYNASSTMLGTIAIGYNASATRNNSIAIGQNASVVAGTDTHGIAIGGGKTADDAAQAGRNTIAMGYNVRLGEAGHSFGFGTNLTMKGSQNIAISAAGSSTNPTKVYGLGNTVIGVNNKLEGLSSSTGYDGAVNYNDMVKNLVYGEGNTITGTSGADATDKKDSDGNIILYEGNTGAYKNSIIGSGNTLSGNNYHNRLLASDSTLNQGAHHNTLIGSKITVNNDIHGSYVLGSNVNVTTNNSVYFGDASTAYANAILTTVNNGNPTTANLASTDETDIDNIEKYGLTAGELGQTSAIIGGRAYRFAGVGTENGGVISVGRVVGMTANNSVAGREDTIHHYASVGRIIQNVAPGLIGASSTDAVNGSQLYAVMTAVDTAIARVSSGENGPVVYTTDEGERLYKENNIFYKPEVTTTLEGITYQQASNGLWYRSDHFENGLLKSDVNASEGKTLADLAVGRTEGDNSVIVEASSVVLSTVNAEKDSNDNTKAEATTTVTVLQNLKESVAVNRPTESDILSKAKTLYNSKRANNEPEWNNDTAPATNVQNTWKEKARLEIMQEGAKNSVSTLLSNKDARDLSTAANKQDLQTLAMAGLDFAADSGTTHRNLSETLTLKGDGKYITTEVKGDGVIGLSFTGTFETDLAALDKGLSFSGDFGKSGTNTFTRKLGQAVNIKGDIITTTETRDGREYTVSTTPLTTGNIGVISNGVDQLTVKLASELVHMNSIAFGANDKAKPFVKMTLEGPSTYTENTEQRVHTSSVLRLSAATKGNGTATAPRIAGVFTDEVRLLRSSNDDGIESTSLSFKVKGDDDVVTVGDLKASTVLSRNVTQEQINNLWYGFSTQETTGNQTTTRYAIRQMTANSAAAGNIIPIKGDANITVKASNPSNNTSEGDLAISLNDEVTFGHESTDANSNPTYTPGKVTVLGDQNNESIVLDGANHTINITDPNNDTRLSLNGTGGTVTFTNNDNDKMEISFTNTIPKKTLKEPEKELKRLSIGTEGGYKALIASMDDGLSFAGNDVGVNIDRLLNEKLTIKGGFVPKGTGENNTVTPSDISFQTTAANTYVQTDTTNHALIVRLSKVLTDLQSAEFSVKDGDVTYTTKVDGKGITIIPKKDGSPDEKEVVSLTNNGLNNGGKVITNVGVGTALTDAVNLQQLNEVSERVEAANQAAADATQGFNVKVSADGGQSSTTMGTDGDNIKPGKSIEFVAGKNVTLEQSDGKIKISTNDQAIVNNTVLPIDYVTESKDANGHVSRAKVYKGADGQFYTDQALAQNVDTSGNYKNPQGQVVSAADKRISMANVITAIQNPDGSFSQATTLSNVADGRIASGSTDAINGSQLADFKAALEQYFGMEITNNTTVVNNNSTTVNEFNPVEVREYTTVVTTKEGESVIKTVRVPLDNKGKPYLKTYNVSDQSEYITNNLYSAVQNMNEQGIKYFHTKDNQEVEEQAGNTDDSSAASKFSTAIGYRASVESESTNAVAMGPGATVIKGSENAIAIGQGGTTVGKNTISIGTGNTVAGEGSGAIGDPSTINAKSTYSVGNDNEIGSADEIVTLKQLIEERNALAAERPVAPDAPVSPKDPGPNASDQQLSDFEEALKKYEEERKAYDAKFEKYKEALNTYKAKRDVITQKIIEAANNISTEDVMALGNKVKVGGKASSTVAVGSDISVGNGAARAVAVGKGATIAENATDAIAVGSRTQVDSANGVAIGSGAKVTTKDANSIALGAGSQATQSLEQLQSAKPFGIETNPNIVGYGKDVVGEVSVGSVNEETGEQQVRRITNVAAGSAPTDAVNVSQLYGLGQGMSKQISELNNRVNGLEKDMDAVGATAAALAGLPQATLPGKSMVAMSSGTYKSQQAFAIGISRLSDNGRLILKGQLGHNTRGDTSASVGIGYQW